MRKFFKWIGIIILIPVILLILVAILLYIPAFQNFAAQKAAEYVSEKYNMDVSLKNIHLTFPLNLKAEGVAAVSHQDTLLSVNELELYMHILPLFSGEIKADAYLNNAAVNTFGLIESAQIKGHIEQFMLKSAQINLISERAALGSITLNKAELDVALRDSVAEDTASTPVNWLIQANEVSVARTRFTLHTPGDTMRIQVTADDGGLSLYKGYIDLKNEIYQANGGIHSHACNVNYDNIFEKPVNGLDFNHLALKKIQFNTADSVSYRQGNLTLILKDLSMEEKCGLKINQLTGTVQVDSTSLHFSDCYLETPYSHAEATCDMDWNALEIGRGGNLNVNLLAQIGNSDIIQVFRDLPTENIKKYLSRPLIIRGAVNGNMENLRLTGVQMRADNISAKAEGYIQFVTDSIRRKGNIDFQADNIGLLVPIFTDPATISNIEIPYMKMGGKALFEGTLYTTDSRIQVGKGSIGLKGTYDTKGDKYNANVDVKDLQLHDFLPKDSLYQLTAKAEISGQGLDFYHPATHINLQADIEDFGYGHINFKGVQMKSETRNNKTTATIISKNPLCELNADLTATIQRKQIDTQINMHLTKANLYEMRVMDVPFIAAGDFQVGLQTNLDKMYRIKAEMKNMAIITQKETYHPKDLFLDAATAADSTFAVTGAGDLAISFHAKHDLWTLMSQSTKFSNELIKELDNKYIEQNKLKELLPELSLKINSGQSNPLVNWLAMSGVKVKNLYADMTTSPLSGINGNAHLYKLQKDSITLDTIRVRILQDSTGVKYFGQVRNAVGNPQFTFDAIARGEIYHKGATLEAKYFNDQHKLGLDMGVRCEMYDDGWGFFVTPEKPLIVYNTYNVNKDQYVFIHKNGRIYANLNLLDKDGSGIKLHSAPNEQSKQELIANLCNIDLAHITDMLPYVPRISGMMNSEIRYIRGEINTSFTGDLQVKKLSYEDSPLGNVEMNMLYLPTNNNQHVINMGLKRENKEIATLSGTYTNDKDGHLNGELSMTQFPMDIANGFITDHLFGFTGYSSGNIKIQGSLKRPLLDGELQLDSMRMYSDIYGVNFRFTDDPVRIVNSNLLLENFDVYAVGNEPFTVQGNINFSNLDKISLDLKMQAFNYQLLNAKRKLNSVLFGQIFANFNSTLKGTLHNLVMRGNLNVLSNTDMTYVMTDSPLTVEDRLNDLVTFVSFDDSTYVAREEEEKAPYTFMGLDMSMGVRIAEGAQVKVELSSDRQSYVLLEGGGNLTFKYTPQGDMYLTGKYTLNSGEMRYEMPIIPLKTFTLASGSSVDFTGDMWNPKLNLSAKERMRASVTENDQPRTVTFDVGVDITNTLQKMGLEFTLAAPEDVTIQNQLAAMTAAERGKLAVTLLATGMYMGEGYSSKFSMNNALNSFLQSEITNIAGSALQTVDISVGIEDNTSASGKTSTDYSFRFSKRLWNNRVRVIIGGKVSSGGDASGQGQSFIDDVSLEYRLDQSGTRYVKLFHDKNYDSMLDGEITETGGGIVLRKKIDKFSDLFLFRKRKKRMQAGEKISTEQRTVTKQEK